jgi:hypothetical protein
VLVQKLAHMGEREACDFPECAVRVNHIAQAVRSLALDWVSSRQFWTSRASVPDLVVVVSLRFERH